GLLQAEGRQTTHLLDDLDLLVADGVEDDVELVLLLGGFGATLAATGGGGGRAGHGDRGGGGDVERLLELLHELGELDEGELLESVDELVGAELRHEWRSFLCVLLLLREQRFPVDAGVLGRMAQAAAACFSRRASTARAAWVVGALNT